MILPSKHLSQDRALLTTGARLLALLRRPKTVSALWNEVRANGDESRLAARISYDWYVLALDLLFLFGAIELKDGLVARRSR